MLFKFFILSVLIYGRLSHQKTSCSFVNPNSVLKEMLRRNDENASLLCLHFLYQLN